MNVTKLNLCKPISLVKIYKNNKLERTVTNTITRHGLDAIMTSTNIPLVDENGGRLRNLVLGHGSIPVNYDSDAPQNVIATTGLVTTATVKYVDENTGRFAYASLIYRFTNPVLNALPIRQLMITTEDSSDPILFGLTLENPLDVSDGAKIDIVYTIRFPVMSGFTTFSSGTLFGTGYTLRGKFNTEATNTIQYDWPNNTNNAIDTTTAVSRFYVDDNLLPANSGRYQSMRYRENYRYTQHIYMRILGNPPGAISINKLEYGAVVEEENSYTLRLNFNGDVDKLANEVFNLEVLLIVSWDESSDNLTVPEVYGSLNPNILLTS